MITPPLGQDKLVGFFKKAIREDSLGHAYIIEGDTGIGKKTLAGYFAAMAVCAEGTACGECKQCKQTIAEVNPDITVLSADGKASIGVDAVRDFISTVAYRSVHGGRHVFIIHDADLLTVQAQNALLKVIEEPPKGVLFLLLCKQKAQLLRTITSRSQILKLSPLPKEVLSKIVPDCGGFELTYCKGNPGTLIRICADEEFKEFRNNAVDVVAKVFTDGDEALYDAVDFFEANKERKEDLFTITLYVLRDVMCKKNGLTPFIINADKANTINAVSAVLTPATCMRAIESVLEAERGMGKYGNFNLAVQSMFIRARNAMKNGNNKQMC
ncbi:MAG: DNA polymerase III subunit delta' [Clostridia bacterium]|nr:DNA polymerase III subunit delta' [Clostridia bacterium]